MTVSCPRGLSITTSTDRLRDLLVILLVQAARDWKLLSEPWIFVVDGDGIVTSSLMLIFDDAELEAAIAAVE